MKILAFLIIGIWLSLMSVASAQLSMTGVGGAFGGTASACSKSLNFSQGCNSQYLALTIVVTHR